MLCDVIVHVTVCNAHKGAVVSLRASCQDSLLALLTLSAATRLVCWQINMNNNNSIDYMLLQFCSHGALGRAMNAPYY